MKLKEELKERLLDNPDPKVQALANQVEGLFERAAAPPEGDPDLNDRLFKIGAKHIRNYFEGGAQPQFNHLNPGAYMDVPEEGDFQPPSAISHKTWNRSDQSHSKYSMQNAEGGSFSPTGTQRELAVFPL